MEWYLGEEEMFLTQCKASQIINAVKHIQNNLWCSARSGYTFFSHLMPWNKQGHVRLKACLSKCLILPDFQHSHIKERSECGIQIRSRWSLNTNSLQQTHMCCCDSLTISHTPEKKKSLLFLPCRNSLLVGVVAH